MSLGADKLSGDGDAAEYPCLKRFRYRRLITMLWLQGFEATAESYVSSFLSSPPSLMACSSLQDVR